jgi:hypothetical protein
MIISGSKLPLPPSTPSEVVGLKSPLVNLSIQRIDTGSPVIVSSLDTGHVNSIAIPGITPMASEKPCDHEWCTFLSLRIGQRPAQINPARANNCYQPEISWKSVNREI